MKTIIWDIDDVLNDLTHAWLEKVWLPLHPECHVRYENVTENPPQNLLGIGKQEYLVSLDAFRLSPEADRMVPDDQVLGWFKRYGRYFRHIALTARPRKTVFPAIEWVLRHYGEWFQTFSYVPAERPSEPTGHPDQDKHDFLFWLGKADYFIDDSPYNVDEAQKLGIDAYLVAQPWNGSTVNLMDILHTIMVKGGQR